MLEDLNNYKFINSILIKTKKKHPRIYELTCQAFESNQTFMIIEYDAAKILSLYESEKDVDKKMLEKIGRLYAVNGRSIRT